MHQQSELEYIQEGEDPTGYVTLFFCNSLVSMDYVFRAEIHLMSSLE